MKLVIMGTGGFIIPSMEALWTSRHEISAVITMPLRVQPTRRRTVLLPVREFVKTHSIPLYDPENINSEEGLELLDRLAPDLIFICDYGKILSVPVIEKAKYGGINLHGSLLPKYRGAAPINRAILAGEKELGVSVIQIVPRVDAGPILGKDSYRPDVTETAVEIEAKLSQLGVRPVMTAIEQIENGKLLPLDQNDQLASGAPRLKKEEGIIDWTRTSQDIINQYRGLQPWPKTFSNWYKKEVFDADQLPKQDAVSTRLILGPFSSVEMSDSTYDENILPGTVLPSDNNQLLIKTGDGIVKIDEVQPANKAKISAEAFRRGYPIKPGDRLI